MTKGYKIAISIDNIVKKLANICKPRIKLTECIVKLLVSTYSYNKYLLFGGFKLLKDEKNIPIFLFFTDKI